MGKRGKQYRQAKEKYDSSEAYPVEEALALLPQLHFVKFDESVDVAVRLGVDPKRAGQCFATIELFQRGVVKAR